MKKNTILKDALVLTLITLAAGGLLGLVYEVTKDPIAQQAEKKNRKPIRLYFKMRIPLKSVWKRKMQRLQLIFQKMVSRRRASMRLWRQRTLPEKRLAMLLT